MNLFKRCNCLLCNSERKADIIVSRMLSGQAPNLPWWRIQNMSDEEIEKHNDSFMMIERLPEEVIGKPFYPYSADPQWDTIFEQKPKPEAIGKPLKIVGIEKAKEPSIFEREIWNAAIEAAANIAEEWANGTASEIRKLKK